MKKFLVAAVAALAYHTASSQELAADFSTFIDKKTDVFHIVEEDRKQVALFCTGKENIRAFLLNGELKAMDSLEVPRKKEIHETIKGYSNLNDNYRIFWSGSKSNTIGVQTFDFAKKKNGFKEIPLTFEKEAILKHITVKGIFYILTVVRNSNILNVYKFENESFIKKTIDLSDKKFVGHDNKFSNLYAIFGRIPFGENHGFDPEMISDETPPSLVLSSKKRKVYALGNQIALTLDVAKNYTQIIRINLDDFSYYAQFLGQPKLDGTDIPQGESNSLLMDDKIIQMRSISGKLMIKVKNNAGEELKSFEMLADTEIPFKNSDIIQENGSVTDIRILDKSNQLIRKINNLEPSLSAYSLNDRIYLTVGGVSPPQNNSAMMYGGMIGGFSGALIAAAITSSYSMKNLNSYNGKKVVYINCLFDTDFNHIEGQSKKLAFDRLRVFAEKHKDLRNATLFKLNNALYFGGYKKDTKKYLFYKFSDENL